MRPTTDLERLMYAAYAARRWFKNRADGNGSSGPHDDVVIARDLDAAVKALAAQVPPLNDLDREEFAVHTRREDFFGAGSTGRGR